MPPGAKSAAWVLGLARFIGFARTTRRIERAQQLDRGRPRILHAMAYAYGEENAAASLEFTRFVIGVHNPVAFQDESGFFIGVVVDRSFAGRNPSRELGDQFAAEVPIDQVTEQTVLAGANVFAKVFVHEQPRRLAGPRRQRTIDDLTPRVLRAARADQTNGLRTS